jgi:hypothetical protein
MFMLYIEFGSLKNVKLGWNEKLNMKVNMKHDVILRISLL